MFVCVCLSVFPVISVQLQISVVGEPIKLNFVGEVEDTQFSILRKIHNHNFHDKNANEK